MGVRIFLPEVRISYAQQLFTPKKVQASDANAKYGATFYLPSNSPVVQQITDAIGQVIRETYPNGPPANLRGAPWADGTPDGFPGFIRIRTYATSKPEVVEGDLSPVINPDRVYSGCYVNASISVYTYKPQPTPGVTFGLDGVQFVREGERLDGRPTVEQMFPSIAGAPAPAAGAPTPGAAPPGPQVAPANPAAPPGAPKTPAGSGGPSWS